uniref:Uncharacterized protein n=1 Tax=Brassica campestris TaxID=3711 RepID=A0A3P5YJJ9_BRACM|nr:unnamed protein product [Brassica rapa]
MGLAFNHAVLDGTATWHFMSSWAEICRGAKTISTQPFLDRAKARDTRVKLDLTAPKDPNAGDGAAEPPQLVLRLRHPHDQVKSQLGHPIRRLKTFLHFPVPHIAHMAPRHPRAWAQTRRHNCLHLFREHDPGHLHGDSGGAPGGARAGVRSFGGAESDRGSRRACGGRAERGVGEVAEDIPVQRRGSELRGGGELAEVQGVRG